LGVPFLGAVPLDPAIVDCGDDGRPLVIAYPDTPAAQAYRDIAATLSGRVRAKPGLPTPFDWQWANDGSTPLPAPVAGHPGGAAAVPVALHRRDGRTLVVPRPGSGALATMPSAPASTMAISLGSTPLATCAA